MCIRDSIRTADGKNLTLKDIIKSDSFDILVEECEQAILDSYQTNTCLLYTSDAADERSSVDLGGRRIIKKKKNREDIG